MIKEVARLLLPGAAYAAGKKWAGRYGGKQRPQLPPLNAEVFVELLTGQLALDSGDVVFVHSSLDRLQPAFSFMRVLPALRRAVGAEGTLLFPATQLLESPEVWLARGELFDVQRCPTAMGLLAEMARRQPDAVRSLHPTHSVVALGAQAHELVDEHHLDRYPCGELSPFYKIAACGGSIIGLGVDADVLTFVHCIEDIWQERFPVQTRRRQLYAARVRDLAGDERVVETLVAHPRIRWRHMLAYMREHIGADLCRRFSVAGRPFYRVDAAELYARMEALVERNITMYSPRIYRGKMLEPYWSRLAEKLEER
jgi:aminoglycoside 3-N-acetyltransferase